MWLQESNQFYELSMLIHNHRFVVQHFPGDNLFALYVQQYLNIEQHDHHRAVSPFGIQFVPINNSKRDDHVHYFVSNKIMRIYRPIAWWHRMNVLMLHRPVVFLRIHFLYSPIFDTKSKENVLFSWKSLLKYVHSICWNQDWLNWVWNHCRNGKIGFENYSVDDYLGSSVSMVIDHDDLAMHLFEQLNRIISEWVFPSLRINMFSLVPSLSIPTARHVW